MTQMRLNRLFGKNKKCFNVAIDHGFFGEAGFLAGIENHKKAIKTVVDANPDVIQLTIGQSHYLQNIPGKAKPTLALRTDIANIYGKKLPDVAFSHMIEDAVEQALRVDAGCVAVNLFEIPNASAVTKQCVKNILKLKPVCERFGMPMMVEPLVFRPNDQVGGYMVDGDVNKIVPLVRQATELGADIIKADPTDDVSLYHHVIEIAGDIPVLVRGGSKATDEEILTRTYGLMQQGAAGIVYGRNIIQHENPKKITKALMGIVHEGLTVQEALCYLDKAA